MPKGDIVRRIEQRVPAGTAYLGVLPAMETVSNGGSPSAYDRIIYVNNGICSVVDGRTGALLASGSDHAAVIQAALDAAGPDTTVAFSTGIYTLSAPLTPTQRQTFWLSAGTRFAPGGDNTLWDITSRDRVAFHGTLLIDDQNAVLTSVPAIIIEDVAFSYFERIRIENAWRGIDMSGTAGGTHENYFGDIWMQVRDRGINFSTEVHDNHFMHVWIKGPAPDNWATGPGLRIATDMVQGGNAFFHIEILDMQWGMDLPGAFEVWFGNVIIDNAYGNGIWISGQCEALFFDTVWTSSGGDGVMIQGNDTAVPTTYADKIHIGKLYTWLNGNHGIRFDGYVQHVTIDTLVMRRNAKGLAFYGSHNQEITIGSLLSIENTEMGVNGENAGANVVIQEAAILDSLSNGDAFAHLGGHATLGRFKSAGVATILSGQISVVVTHGLDSIPTVITLGPDHAEVSGAYISARDWNTFTITVATAVTANRTISWVAASRTNGM